MKQRNSLNFVQDYVVAFIRKDASSVTYGANNQVKDLTWDIDFSLSFYPEQKNIFVNDPMTLVFFKKLAALCFLQKKTNPI